MKSNYSNILLSGLILLMSHFSSIAQDVELRSDEIKVNDEILIQANGGTNSNPVLQFVTGGIFREIGLLGGDLMGIDGDVVPYNSTSFDLGNNVVGQHWDQVVCNQLIELLPQIKSINTTSKKLEKTLDRISGLKIYTYQNEIYLDSKLLKHHFPEVFISENNSEKNIDAISPESLEAVKITALISVLFSGLQEQQKLIQSQAEDLEKIKIILQKLYQKESSLGF